MKVQRLYSIALFIVLVTLAAACGKNEDSVVGRWQATWQADPKAYGDIPGNPTFEMSGFFDFSGNGQIQIEGYGHEGCVIASDTLRHTLRWQMTADTLHLTSAEDPYGLYYTILEKKNNQMKLRLIEDITITLKKQ